MSIKFGRFSPVAVAVMMAAAVVVLVGASFGVAKLQDREPSVESSTSSPMIVEPGTATPSEPRLTAAEIYAAKLLEFYPEFYMCPVPVPVPPSSRVQLADLIPTTNVVAVIGFDQGKFVLQSANPHITVQLTEPEELIGETGQPYRLQKATWSFDAPTTKLFNSYFHDAGGWHTTGYATTSNGKVIYLYPDGGVQQYLIVGTDTATCDGNVDLVATYGFSWNDVDASGGLRPAR